MDLSIILALLVCLLAHNVMCGELTFELPDNEKMCFHEVIDKGVSSTLEFQVVMGGNYDVDMELTAPNGQVLYKDVKKQYDSFTWTPDYKGVHSFCFSNEFSTFTHKVVYFDLQVGEEKPVVDNQGEHATAMTMVEASSANIHGSLSMVSSMQTYFRNREATGRDYANTLNHHVALWSLGETIAVLIVGLGQVLVLRSFFAATGPRSSMNGAVQRSST